MKNRKIPKYIKIKELLIKEIIEKNLKEGDKLPSIPSLMKRFKMSFQTVWQAMRELSSKGVVKSVRGKGIYVVEIPEKEVCQPIEPFSIVNNKITLIYGNFEHIGKQGETWQKIIYGFEKRYPNIKIRQVSIANDDIFYTSKELNFDIFQVTTKGFHIVIDRNLVCDLTSLIKSDSNLLSGFIPDVLSLCKFKDKFYGFPFSISVTLLYYNKKCFDRLNIPYPDERWDWQKYVDTTKRLRKNSENKQFGSCFFMSVPTIFSIFDNNFININKEYVNFCTGKGEFLLGILSQLSEEELGIKNSIDYNMSLFIKNKLSMFCGGTFYLCRLYNLMKVDYGVTKLPNFSKNIINGMLNCISNKTPYLWEAWKFLKYLTTEEALKPLAEIKNNIPVLKKLASSLSFLSLNSQNLNFVLDEIKHSSKNIFSPPIEREIQQILIIELRRFLNKELSIDETLKNMSEKCTQYLTLFKINKQIKEMA